MTNEGGDSTITAGPYVSCYPDNSSNFSVFPDVFHYILGGYFNFCSALYRINNIWKYQPAPEKYWVK